MSHHGRVVTGPQTLAGAISAAIILAAASACGGATSQTPKPRAFPRVEFPVAAGATAFRLEVCPFTFDYPSYVDVEQDTLFFDDRPEHPCWFDLVTPALDGRVYVSYYPISSPADFEQYRDDAYELVGKHNVVATYIDEQPIERPAASVYGYSFAVEGDAASPYQLFVTDSTRHFLRAAVYVNAKARADSLQPVYEFLREDLDRVVGSLSWK